MRKTNDFKINSKNENNLNLVGKIKVKVLVVLSFVVAVSFFGQLVFASTLAVEGQKLSEIEGQINNLEAQNTTIRVEIAKQSSLTNLSSQAEKMGFEKPSEVIIP